MDTWELVALSAFGAIVVGAFGYTVFRLAREPRTGLDERSTWLARFFLYPRFFDPLLAKPLTKREKLGWVLVGAVMVAAVVLTSLTGIGSRH